MPRSQSDAPTARALLEHEIDQTGRQIEWVSFLLSETRKTLAVSRALRRAQRRRMRLRRTEPRV
jgi:hypothetical protein